MSFLLYEHCIQKGHFAMAKQGEEQLLTGYCFVVCPV